MGVGGVKSVPLVLVGTGGEGEEGTRGENSKEKEEGTRSIAKEEEIERMR